MLLHEYRIRRLGFVWSKHLDLTVTASVYISPTCARRNGIVSACRTNYLLHCRNAGRNRPEYYLRRVDCKIQAA